MSYGPYGRTPEMARRERVYEWLTILAIGLMVACVFAAAAIVVAVLS